MPITWKNVQGSNLTGAGRLMESAGRSFDRAFTGLEDVLEDGVARVKEGDRLTTNAFLDEVRRSYEDPEALSAARKDGSIQALRDGYRGLDPDRSGVQAIDALVRDGRTKVREELAYEGDKRAELTRQWDEELQSAIMGQDRGSFDRILDKFELDDEGGYRTAYDNHGQELVGRKRATTRHNQANWNHNRTVLEAQRSDRFRNASSRVMQLLDTPAGADGDASGTYGVQGADTFIDGLTGLSGTELAELRGLVSSRSQANTNAGIQASTVDYFERLDAARGTYADANTALARRAEEAGVDIARIGDEDYRRELESQIVQPTDGMSEAELTEVGRQNSKLNRQLRAISELQAEKLEIDKTYDTGAMREDFGNDLLGLGATLDQRNAALTNLDESAELSIAQDPFEAKALADEKATALASDWARASAGARDIINRVNTDGQAKSIWNDYSEGSTWWILDGFGVTKGELREMTNLVGQTIEIAGEEVPVTDSLVRLSLDMAMKDKAWIGPGADPRQHLEQLAQSPAFKRELEGIRNATRLVEDQAARAAGYNQRPEAGTGRMLDLDTAPIRAGAVEARGAAFDAREQLRTDRAEDERRLIQEAIAYDKAQKQAEANGEGSRLLNSVYADNSSGGTRIPDRVLQGYRLIDERNRRARAETLQKFSADSSLRGAFPNGIPGR